MIFGERSELLNLAKHHLIEGENVYIPKIYGVNEVGGTAVMYISHIPLDFLGYSGTPIENPMPELTWNWLNKVPSISISVAGIMTGLLWIIERRMQVETSQKSKNNSPGTEK
jgi:formate dehydrogenase iron-sulfur subunit